MRCLAAAVMIVAATAALSDGIQDEKVRVLGNLDAALRQFQGRVEADVVKEMGGPPSWVALNQLGYKILLWPNEEVPHYELRLTVFEGVILRDGRVIGVSKAYSISSMPTGLCGEVIESIERRHGRRKSYFDTGREPGQVEGLWELGDQDIVFARGREHHLLKGELARLHAKLPDWS